MIFMLILGRKLFSFTLFFYLTHTPFLLSIGLYPYISISLPISITLFLSSSHSIAFYLFLYPYISISLSINFFFTIYPFLSLHFHTLFLSSSNLQYFFIILSFRPGFELGSRVHESCTQSTTTIIYAF